MKTYTLEELKSILADHLKWLRGESGGKRADLSGAALRSADLSGANLSGADLRMANLSGADLISAALSGANLRMANLRMANLSGANLSGANLSGADLRSAALRSADLSGANLSGADLSGADLSGANLSGANLSGADLSGAVLSESTGFRYAQVSWTGHGERGRMLSAVELPDGLRMFCGCFQGTPEQLREYIVADGKDHWESRTKAMEFVLTCF